MDNDSKYVHDAYASSLERTIRRLWITVILLILLLFGSYIGFVYYESQFKTEETTTIDTTQDGSGINIVGGGDIKYEPTSENYQN